MSTNIQNVSDIVRFLERSMKRHTRSSRPMEVPDILRRLPHLSEASVDTLYDTFVQRRLYERAAIVAVRYDRVEKLVKSRARSSLYLLWSFWGDLLRYLYKKQRWRSIKTLISSVHYPHPKTLIRLSQKPLGDEEALTVYNMLLSRCGMEHGSLLRRVVRAVVFNGLVNQYKLLVHSDNDNVRLAVLYGAQLTTPTAPDELVKLASNQLSPGYGGYDDFNGCLTVACEAGLFTVLHYDEAVHIHETAMGLAVTRNKPNLVRFVHSVGAVSNSQLFKLAHYQVQMNPLLAVGRDPHSFARDAADIQRFLAEAASHPRALKSLCVLEVSKHLGWGHGREARIDSLELPSVLKDTLKFKDNGPALWKGDSDKP